MEYLAIIVALIIVAIFSYLLGWGSAAMMYANKRRQRLFPRAAKEVK